MEFERLKNITIGEFRKVFFCQKADAELIKEFDMFCNKRNIWGFYEEYLQSYAKYLSEKIYEETRIGKKIGNLALLKARFLQNKKNLEVFLEEESKNKHEQFTEQGFVEWMASVSKYYGYEISETKSVFDFLVMSNRMREDLELQQKELNRIKTKRK